MPVLDPVDGHTSHDLARKKLALPTTAIDDYCHRMASYQIGNNKIMSSLLCVFWWLNVHVDFFTTLKYRAFFPPMSSISQNLIWNHHQSLEVASDIYDDAVIWWLCVIMLRSWVCFDTGFRGWDMCRQPWRETSNSRSFWGMWLTCWSSKYPNIM